MPHLAFEWSESNAYTIGCSLAGAYGHAALRGQPDLFRQAAVDADWLMPRTSKLNGAFIESFVFAHAFAETPERRKLYADYLHSAFLEGPLRVGPFHGEIDNLHIENPRPAVVRLRNLTAHAVLLYAGQPIRVSADVVHYAQAV